MSTLKKSTLKKSSVEKNPTRNEVAIGDTWDLTTLYASDADWEKDFKKYEFLKKSSYDKKEYSELVFPHGENIFNIIFE